MSSCASSTLARLVLPLSGMYMIHSCDRASKWLNSLIIGGGGSWMAVSEHPSVFIN